MTSQKRDIRLLLDNIRSIHNVGSIFRTADTLGISHIYCVGATPVPIDRFGRKRGDFAKVSLGAEDSVSWEHVRTDVFGVLVKKLKNEGFQIVALEQDQRSIDYKAVRAASPALIIVGNEVEGISGSLLNEADIIAEIPQRGTKESLNVSVAAGVFLFRIIDN